MATIPVAYMERSRAYYEAQGYEKPYKWAHHLQTPFSHLKKPLKNLRATIVTTAMPDKSYQGKYRRLAQLNLSEPPTSLFTGGLFWDRWATHTDDRETYLPIKQLNQAISQGYLGSLADFFYCVPTMYSISQTKEKDAPAVVESCLNNNVDVAFLVPL